MAGSSYGKMFTFTTWGESHGAGVGVVIDGCPAGIPLSEADIQLELDKRKPGTSPFTTPRKEDDIVQIMSGVFEGITTGTPISCIVMNQDQRSKDYGNIATSFRPGHADYTFFMKYGIRDYRGGGRSSARETIARVIAGAVAKKILAYFNIKLTTYAVAIGKIQANPDKFNAESIEQNYFYMPDLEAAAEAEIYVTQMMEEGNSVGGVIECRVDNLPVGLGETVFDKLDAELGKALLSIGAVKGVELGSGFKGSIMNGSEHNDVFFAEEGEIKKKSNNAGGVLGGMSDGSPLLVRAAIKPTSSIGKVQQTVNQNKEAQTIEIKGRHDPVIVPRARFVIEAMVAVTLTDLLLRNCVARIDYLQKIYGNKE